jgi:hypothetical protein
MLEGQHDRAGVGIEQLAQRGDAVVEIVQHRVDVPLEDRAGVGHPQRPTGPVEQRHTDLVFQSGQCPGHAGLGELLKLADLGHRHPVGDLLKPAQRVGIHIYDNNSCFSVEKLIGRMVEQEPTLEA